MRPRAGGHDNKVLVGGSIMFGLSYGLAFTVAVIALSASPGDANGAEVLFIPFAGPFIMIGSVKDEPKSGESILYLVLDGLFQIGGATAMGFGIADAASGRTAISPWIPAVRIGAGAGSLTWQL